MALLAAMDHASSAEGEKKSPGAASPLTTADDATLRAHDALERATRMRNAGDEAHARLSEGLALEWAETARDRARTMAEEAKATRAEQAAIDAGARVERERALLEEAIARSGRLRAELAEVTKKRGQDTAREHTSTAAASDVPPRPKGPPARRGAGRAGAGAGGEGHDGTSLAPPERGPGEEDTDAPSDGIHAPPPPPPRGPHPEDRALPARERP